MIRRQDLVAVVLLLVLTALAFLGWRERENAQLRTCLQNERRIQEALLDYQDRTVRSNFPASLDALVPQFLETLPTCPSSSARYAYERYSDSREGGDFVLSCPGHHPSVPQGFPKASFMQAPMLEPRKFRGGDGEAGSPWLHPTEPDYDPIFQPRHAASPAP